jgi:hemerythrin-like domain-containing protein
MTGDTAGRVGHGVDAADQAGPGRTAPMSRRALINGLTGAAGAAGVAGLAVGAGGTALGYQLTGGHAAATAVIPPSEDLMREHGVLKRILLIYREAGRRVAAGAPLPAAAVNQGASIIRDYIEGFHEGLEEAYVFPRLQRAGQLVDTVEILLLQHARGRLITADVIAATAAGRPLTGTGARTLAARLDMFVRMYEPHEAREDTVVFPTFRAITSPTAFTELGERFAQEEDRQFGAHGFTDMVDRVAAIERSLGINDLSQFTPPATRWSALAADPFSPTTHTAGQASWPSGRLAVWPSSRVRAPSRRARTCASVVRTPAERLRCPRL